MKKLLFYILILIILINVNSIKSKSSQNCPPLAQHRNIEVACYLNNVKLNKCDRPQTPGTRALYKCKPYHVPFDLKENSKTESVNEVTCSTTGEWIDLANYEKFRCKEDCGKLRSNAKPLVINGVGSNSTLWPWHATIFRKSSNAGWTYICGGSLIRNQIIISAAHCFSLSHTQIGNPVNYKVVLGAVSSDYNENLLQGPEVQINNVQRIYVSENYDPKKGYQADIAIVQLKENTHFEDNVIPTCLPNDYNTDLNAIKSGSIGQVAGFGITEDGKISNRLRSISIPVKSSSECFTSLKRTLSDSQFCGGERKDNNWRTVCNGDSGGGICFPSTVHEKYYIHGLVSSGDANTKNKVCQNYAVFTRIYPFIFWIRDIIEEISGEIARDLHQNVPYPFALRGTETQFVNFKGLPREWTNRVTSLEILNARVSPDELLNALEYAKPLTNLNLTSISLNEQKFNSRALLPLLSDFTLDVVDEKIKVNKDRDYPVKITESYLKSHLFFDKDFDEWSLNSLLSLKTNIDLNVGIFKLLHVNIEKGEIFSQQVKDLNEIVRDLGDFKLKKLALHKTSVNFSMLIETHSITTLVLDDVTLLDFTTNEVNFNIVSSNLKELIFRPKISNRLQANLINVPIDKFPNSLELFSASKSVQLTTYRNYMKRSEEVYLPNLHTLCCDTCLIEENIIQNLDKAFSSLYKASFKLDKNKRLDLLKILKHPKLYQILIKSNSQNISNKNFNGIEDFTTIKNSSVLLLEKESNVWKVKIPSKNLSKYFDYFCNGQKYFWTSFEDYITRKRLKSYERAAFNSYNYILTGSKTVEGSFEEFKGIPPEIQNSLKTIKLSSLTLTPKTLLNSVVHAPNLQRLVLTNITLNIGSFNYEKIQKNSIEFELMAMVINGYKFEYVNEYANGVLVGINIPTQHVGRFSKSNFSNSIHKILSSVTSVRLSPNATAIFVLDTPVADIRSLNSHYLNLFSSLEPSNYLRVYSKTLKELHETYRDGLLPKGWRSNGLYVFDLDLAKNFFRDKTLRVIGRLGVLDYLLTRFGHLVTIERSTSLSLLKKNKHPLSFPPLQAMAVKINEERIE